MILLFAMANTFSFCRGFTIAKPVNVPNAGSMAYFSEKNNRA